MSEKPTDREQIAQVVNALLTYRGPTAAETIDRLAKLLGKIRSEERERCARIADEHPDSKACRGDPELVRGCCEVIAGQIRSGK